jgi:hypothetical protein
MPVDKPLSPAAVPLSRTPAYAWWLVLALIGLDYFSTLAYLPSIAVQATFRPEQPDVSLAPLAATAVVGITLFFALPVYFYVVGRSPHGYGATGLLERLLHGWGGKFFLLILLGFIGTDFVVTRTLSVADAAHHITHNPLWRDHVTWVTANKETVRSWFPEALQGKFFDFWNEQLVITVVLSILAFGLYFFIIRGFNRPFMILAAAVVGLYLLLTAMIVGSVLSYLAENPQQLEVWFSKATSGVSQHGLVGMVGFVPTVAFLALLYSPELSLGLSGFELSMTNAPLVRGSPSDDPDHPRRRIRRTRLMLLAAVLIMGVFLLASVLTVSQMVPLDALRGDVDANGEWKGPAMHRALAYLAHGEGKLSGNIHPEDVNPMFGPVFGTLYDLSTVLILCLAGASVAITLKQFVPQYLAKFGMQLHWAEKVGAILHLFNLVILLTTLVFHASVSAQQWAYAASVLVLLTAASLAALLDVRRRWQGSILRWPMALPFFLITLVFLTLVGITLTKNRTGLYIPMLFVGVLVVTAFFSRLLRSTELRCTGFEFSDDASRQRWEEITQLEFQVLVPHRPRHLTLEEKERKIRARHRLTPEVPIIFIEASLNDPSEFFQVPLMQIQKRHCQEVIVVTRCASIAHVLAAIALEFRKVGKPPEIHFGWSEESPITANLGFLLFGEGNIPWMVHALLKKSEPDPGRQPRVVVG